MGAASGAQGTGIRSFRGARPKQWRREASRTPNYGQCAGIRFRLAAMAFDPSYASPRQARVFFERPELTRLLSLYGRMVSAGEWRDYAIDGLSESAVFSVFERTSENPLYRIEKRPNLARRQGA